MDVIAGMPVWALALLIFLLRIVDVSLGTLRTISVVQDRLSLSVLISFFEVLVWVTAVTQVVVRVDENPLLLLAYAAGFAAGNACGITLERHLGLGQCVVRMIATQEGEAMAARLRGMGHSLTTFAGQGRDGPRTLMFTACPRRELRHIIEAAASLDPHLFYTVDRFSQTGHITPLPDPTGWRGMFKKK